MGSHPGNAPQEAAGDVRLVDREGGCQVLGFGQNLGEPLSCLESGSLSQRVYTEKHLNVLGDWIACQECDEEINTPVVFVVSPP